MKDKANSPQSFVKMEEARRLMDQGHYQESLILALDALLQELDNLRSSLLALQTVTRSELPAAAPRPGRAAPPEPTGCRRSNRGFCIEERVSSACRPDLGSSPPGEWRRLEALGGPGPGRLPPTLRFDKLKRPDVPAGAEGLISFQELCHCLLISINSAFSARGKSARRRPPPGPA